MIPLNVNSNDRILVIAPHPDDESIGVGGLLLLFPNQISVVVATDGSRSHSATASEDIKTRRRDEFMTAMSLASVKDTAMLEYVDGELDRFDYCFNKINFGKYTKVFLPNCKEEHTDHISTFYHAIKEIKKQNAENIEVYQYETREPSRNADYYLDITSLIEKKTEMIMCYRSQIELFNHAEFIKSINKYQACRQNEYDKYFEAYTKYDLLNSDGEFGQTNTFARFKQERDFYKKWISNINKKKDFCTILEKNNWNRVCIYGFGVIGQQLYLNLKNNGCQVLFILDENASKVKENSTFLTEDEKGIISLPKRTDFEIDVVIISVLHDAQKIEKKLWRLGYNNIFSIAEFLDQ